MRITGFKQRAIFACNRINAKIAWSGASQKKKLWDTILVDGHGPTQVASIQGANNAYYFRSRKGGAVIDSK